MGSQCLQILRVSVFRARAQCSVENRPLRKPAGPCAKHSAARQETINSVKTWCASVVGMGRACGADDTETTSEETFDVQKNEDGGHDDGYHQLHPPSRGCVLVSRQIVRIPVSSFSPCRGQDPKHRGGKAMLGEHGYAGAGPEGEEGRNSGKMEARATPSCSNPRRRIRCASCCEMENRQTKKH